MVKKVHVVYWGGWNYKPKAIAFIAALEKLCRFEHTLEMWPGSSGAFEVTVDGILVHSKINGDGYVREDKLKEIALIIQEKK